MLYEKKDLSDWLIYSPYGELSLTKTNKIDALYNDVRKEISNGKYRFIFDFKNVSFIDSFGISIVLQAVNIANREKEKVRICGLNNDIDDLFSVVKMNKAFLFFNSIEDAISDISLS